MVVWLTVGGAASGQEVPAG